MGSFSGAPLKVKVVDFSGIDPSSPGSEQWVAVRGEVMAALELYGCFEAVANDGITTEQREVMFGGVMKEVFCLPLEEKLRDATEPEKFFYQYNPSFNHETIGIHDGITLAVPRFWEVLWPQGINPATCEVICSFSKFMLKLDHIVRMMVLESLGVEKYADSLMESSSYLLRLSKYGTLSEGMKSDKLDMHTDATMTTIVCQHQIEGLEIHAKNGQRFVPSRDSINFMIGDSFGAWTNGRLQPCLHGVMDHGNNTRYSVIFGSRPIDGYIMQVPEVLVSEEHPLQYKPYKYDEYFRYRYVSNPKKHAERTLKAYCGVGVESKEKMEA